MIRDVNEPITDLVALQNYIAGLLDESEFDYESLWVVPMADPATAQIGLLFNAEIKTGAYKKHYQSIIREIYNKGFPEKRIMNAVFEVCELTDDTLRMNLITKFRLCDLTDVSGIWQYTKRICTYDKCGKEFTPTSKTQSYCNMYCASMGKTKRVDIVKICESKFCKKEFITKDPKRRFCKWGCSQVGRVYRSSKKDPLICVAVDCENEFMPRNKDSRYCSVSCARKTQLRERGVRLVGDK